MNSKQTWSLADSYCQFEAKFRTLMIEETLSATNFRFVAKIHRKSVLCSDEMSLNRPWTFDRIFVRTFDERSLEQITKFAEFRLHYFCTILYVRFGISLNKLKLNSRNWYLQFYPFSKKLEYTGRNICLHRQPQPCMNKIKLNFKAEIISTAGIYGTKNLFYERYYLFQEKFRMILKLISAPEIERNVNKTTQYLHVCRRSDYFSRQTASLLPDYHEILRPTHWYNSHQQKHRLNRRILEIE